ncbi:hypothetical protein RclHR1_00040020 [Rhizophagus clarus]|nr:hypothetical protein RclHR1_00040020 [Rhizophagus clarus]
MPINLLEHLSEEVLIEVGDASIFRAHAFVLYFRSSYFRRAILSHKNENDETLTHIRLPNISTETFRIILRYIYGERISLEEYHYTQIVKLLTSANELGIQDLVTYVQAYLIRTRASYGAKSQPHA